METWTIFAADVLLLLFIQEVKDQRICMSAKEQQITVTLYMYFLYILTILDKFILLVNATINTHNSNLFSL